MNKITEIKQRIEDWIGNDESWLDDITDVRPKRFINTWKKITLILKIMRIWTKLEILLTN